MSIFQIDQLRAELHDKFPQAHRALVPEESHSESDSHKLAFREGHVSEVVASGFSSGLSLLFSELLSQSRDLPVALIDGQDCFDPASHGNTRCRQLLWVRCQKTEQAIQCADLLLRDGNLPLVLLDLHLSCERELRQIPLAVWHRFKGQARDSGAALVALTPRPLVPTPHQRIIAEREFSLKHLELEIPRSPFMVEGCRQQQRTGGLAP